MSEYSMADIVSITGINAHTLRKWESRYHFIEPKRTATNIRFYTDDQLRKLLNVGILINNGYRISKIDGMSEGEIHNLVSKFLLESAPQDDLKALIACMLNLDEIGFNEIFNRHFVKHGFLNTTTDLIYPFLNHVGVLWGTNKVMPAQEHFISNLIKQKMFKAIDAISLKKENNPTIVLFLIEGESHEIGLLLANYIAKELGWRSIYLGQNVPLEDIIEVIKITKPDLLMTMLTMFKPNKTDKIISSIINEIEVQLAISGGQNLENTLIENETIVELNNPGDFMDLLKIQHEKYMSSNT